MIHHTFFRFLPAAPILRVARPCCWEDTVAELVARRPSGSLAVPFTIKPLLGEARRKTLRIMQAACNLMHLMLTLSNTHTAVRESELRGYMRPIPRDTRGFNYLENQILTVSRFSRLNKIRREQENRHAGARAKMHEKPYCI